MVQGLGIKISLKLVLENRQVGDCVKGGREVLGKIGVFKFQVGDCWGIGVSHRDSWSFKMNMQVGAC